jgi:hypothetical protein
MDEPRRIDGEELDLPLNQEPGTAVPQIEFEIEKGKEERGNKGPEDMPGFGQGA